MKTNLPKDLLNTFAGQRADEILRKCVHCGFCNATCPTHQLTGDELDGPRGRIYLIKEMLEGNTTTISTLKHLDNCLTCLNCETTCPSGVNYGELVEIGREHIEQKKIRNYLNQLKRQLICSIFPFPNRFKPFYTMASLCNLAPKSTHIEKTPTTTTHNKKVLLLDGCVQNIISPEINDALATILDQSNIEAVTLKETHCCGAIHHHNGNPEKALQIIKTNIDAWWPYIESGCEAIIMTASGCGLTVKDYSRLLHRDKEYANKAARISSLTQDASEYLSSFGFSKKLPYHTVAFHPPCTLQHGQKINGVVEGLLQRAGFQCIEFNDKHLCCGSAGTYSILQPKLATQLKENKINHIMQNQPDVIATANIGCLLHLQKGSPVPVKHWLELVAIDN